MKFTAERATLLKALAHVQSVVEKRNTIPILANLMMSVRQGALTLTATDMEIALVEQVAATTSRDGTATAPAATLYEIVRKLPEGAQVELDHPGGDAPLALRAGRFATSLMVLPADDFPSMTAGSLPHSFRLPAQTLRGMIDRTRFAISTEETRYYLNGIYLHAADGADGHKMLRAVATDGHRLARVEETLPAGAEAIPGVIVPRKTVAEVRKLIDETSDDIEIGLSETRIQFSLGTLKLTSKLIDGTFPEYERVIPRDNDKILRVGKKDFADAVARVAAISTERSRPVKLALDRDLLTLSAASPDQGSATEELDGGRVTYSSTPMEIGFQARYLNDITDQIGGEVEFLFADGSAPTVVRDAGDPSALYVLMPMRV
ncbi:MULTISPECIES: DNA polymerase III subunit beta [unclassified Acidisoma]|jgi:DNA polymerase III subunit beta|uniref:DNA polymerase III subunit beta n=1 Tax=unclassified Acidisoma TaxID=2634065 RepID=UPI00131A6C08|nr:MULTISPECIES: DNA polymerase III subunit beta [unclassified Acidisoma]